jgi:hypothetical protein
MKNLPTGQAGKTGKYFKYAIGEIVLVVIGILIALQINNWNNNRIQLQEEQQVFKQLLSDVKADSVFFQNRIFGIDQLKKTCNAIIALEEEPNYDITSIITNGTGNILPYSALVYNSNVFSNNEDAYSKINNKAVKEKLRKYRLRYGFIATNYINLNSKLTGIIENVRPRYYKEFRQNVQDSSKITLIKIYSDPYLRSHVDILLTILESTGVRTEQYLEDNHNLMASIRKNLRTSD